MSITAVLRHRRDDSTNWTANNPVLEDGQLGFETDTLRFKVGNGVSSWNALSYVIVEAAAVSGVASTNVVGTATSFARADHQHAGLNTVVVAGNTAGATSSGAGSLVLAGGPNITLSGSTAAGGMTVSVSGGAGGAASSMTIQDGATTIPALAQVALTTANGLALSLSTTTGGSVTIGGSYTVPTVPSIATTVSAVGSANSTGTVTRYAPEDHQHAGLNTVSVVGNTAGATSAGAGSIVLAGGPNITLSGATAAGGMTLSVSAGAGGAGDGVNIIAAGTQTAATTGTVVFSDSNGITFGMSNSSVVTASHNGLTVQSTQPVALSGSNGSFNFSTATFGNLNGLSFYTSNGSMVGSYTVPTVTNSSLTVSGSNDSATAGRIAFVNSNGLSFGLSSNAGSLTITASHDGLTAQSNQSGGLYGVGNTSGTSSGTYDARSISLSGLGAVTVAASDGVWLVNAPSGGGASVEGWNPYRNSPLVAQAFGDGSLWINPMELPCSVAFDRLCQPMFFTHANNSTGTATLAIDVGIYTRNASSLSLLYSTSHSLTVLASGTASSNTWVGPRLLTMPWTSTFAPSKYWVGVVSRSTSGGADVTFSNFHVSQLNSSFSGVLGVAGVATPQKEFGLGRYTATTNAMPASIGWGQLHGNSSAFARQPALFFGSITAE